MYHKIRMNSPKDVEKVSNTVAQTGIPMHIICGSDMIDARSILGLFPFVGKDAFLVAPDSMNPKKFMKLVAKLGVAG